MRFLILSLCVMDWNDSCIVFPNLHMPKTSSLKVLRSLPHGRKKCIDQQKTSIYLDMGIIQAKM